MPRARRASEVEAKSNLGGSLSNPSYDHMDRTGGFVTSYLREIQITSYFGGAELAAASGMQIDREAVVKERHGLSLGEGVQAFLNGNGPLVPVLRDRLPQAVRRFFGNEAKIEVRLGNNSVFTDNGKRLFAVVRTAMTAEGAAERFQKLYHDYWLGSETEAKRNLIGLELRAGER